MQVNYVKEHIACDWNQISNSLMNVIYREDKSAAQWGEVCRPLRTYNLITAVDIGNRKLTSWIHPKHPNTPGIRDRKWEVSAGHRVILSKDRYVHSRNQRGGKQESVKIMSLEMVLVWNSCIWQFKSLSMGISAWNSIKGDDTIHIESYIFRFTFLSKSMSFLLVHALQNSCFSDCYQSEKLNFSGLGR